MLLWWVKCSVCALVDCLQSFPSINLAHKAPSNDKKVGRLFFWLVYFKNDALFCSFPLSLFMNPHSAFNEQVWIRHLVQGLNVSGFHVCVWGGGGGGLTWQRWCPGRRTGSKDTSSSPPCPDCGEPCTGQRSSPLVTWGKMEAERVSQM